MQIKKMSAPSAVAHIKNLKRTNLHQRHIQLAGMRTPVSVSAIPWLRLYPKREEAITIPYVFLQEFFILYTVSTTAKFMGYLNPFMSYSP